MLQIKGAIAEPRARDTQIDRALRMQQAIGIVDVSHAAGGADPDGAVGIRQEGECFRVVAGEAVLDVEPQPVLTVEYDGSLVGVRPQPAARIRANRVNTGVREDFRLHPLAMLEVGAPGTQQSFAKVRSPDRPVRHRDDGGVNAEAAVFVRYRQEGPLTVREAEYAARRRNPQGALAILDDVVNACFRARQIDLLQV